LLNTSNDALCCTLELFQADALFVVTSGDDGSLIANISDISTREPRGQGRELLGILVSRLLLVYLDLLEVDVVDLPSFVNAW